MATVELDPQFIKALRLLRSKSKDSGAQLRAMLDDAIRQKKGLAPRSPSLTKQHSRSVSSDRERGERSEKDKKKDLDRLKKDLSELVDKPTDPKRARLDSPALSSTSLSHSPSPTSISPPPKEENSNSASSDAMEFGDLEMNLEFDCSCCVCKSIVQESGNSLMECNTCQNLYHQGCHVPPVSNDEAKDPRLIWNCMKCTRTKEPEGGEKAKLHKVERAEKLERVEKVGKVASGSGAKKLSSGSKAKESRHGSGLKAGKASSGSSANSSSSSGTGSAELSSSAKKRLKLLKKQAAASTIVKKKTAK